jgi:hypothetical protein
LCGGTVSALKQQSRNQGPEQAISEFLHPNILNMEKTRHLQQ